VMSSAIARFRGLFAQLSRIGIILYLNISPCRVQFCDVLYRGEDKVVM
jgi:hypothetical protein